MPETVMYIGQAAFGHCTGLPSITIPGSVINIGARAFSGCANLETVTLNNGLQSLGELAFIDCAKLASITIPDTVTSIGQFAFVQCTSLESITLPNNPAFTEIPRYMLSSCINLDGVVIPDSVTAIGDQAFCVTGITSITIPANVASIGNYIFIACPLLSAIQVDPSNTHFSSSGGVLYNAGKTTLLTCPGATAGTFTVPAGVAEIAVGAFFECQNLTGVMLTDSLQIIGDHAFVRSGITSVTIPESVTRVGEFAFYNCASLTKAVLLCRSATLGPNAFVASAIASDGIYGFDSSTAQAYAAENGIPFHKLLELVMSPANGEIYTGGKITVTPNIEGGEWSFEAGYLSREGNTFKGLKAGSTGVTYTAGLQSVTADVVIREAELPATGQDFTPALALLAAAVCAGWAALLAFLAARRRRRG